jgi:hypothetical protein
MSPHDDCSPYIALLHLLHASDGLVQLVEGSSSFDYTNNFVAYCTEAIVNFVLQNVDAFDEQCSRVVNALEK